MRVVLDTNVFISGIFWEGNYCSHIINMWKKGIIELVTSEQTIQEFIKTMEEFKFKLPKEIILDWESLMRAKSIIVKPREVKIVEDDPDDDKFIGTALAGKASHVITQDKHLLKIKQYKTITICKPETFLREHHE